VHKVIIKSIGVLSLSTLTILTTGACQGPASKKALEFESDKRGNEKTEVLVVGVKDTAAFRKTAESLGLRVDGTTVLTLQGGAAQLRKLEVLASDKVLAIENKPLIRRHAKTKNSDVSSGALFLAKEDFGLTEYWKSNPTHDGRGVVVGVIDDGFSPHLSGLQKTTDGKRKILRLEDNSSLLNIKLSTDSATPEAQSAFVTSSQTLLGEASTFVGAGFIDENVKIVTYEGEKNLELNVDDKSSILPVALFRNAQGAEKVCVDSNADLQASQGECFGTFAQTGEYGFWDKDKIISFIAEFDAEKGTLKLSQGEQDFDSHGEGVASVMAGHNVANKKGGAFDGVAPGAQVIGFDIVPGKIHEVEERYTIKTFLDAMEWCGKNGANVVNISWGTGFSSPKTAAFVQSATTEIIDKYNFVLSFAGGNEGPGLSSYYETDIFPADILAVGAFVGPKLYESVYGINGLPPEGRVVSYSSVGPGPNHGAPVNIISPLASLTHSSGSEGVSAFGGTSSAAPAAGGLAAVLFSAALQEGLAIDYKAGVHALRMSAQPLPNAPFLTQGYGLPKMAKALEIYRSLMGGKELSYLAVNAGTTAEGLTKQGLFFKSSEISTSTLEAQIKLTGKVPNAIELARSLDVVREMRVSYSHPWLTGPSVVWAGAGSTSDIYVHLNTKQAFASQARRHGEVFSEILLHDKENGRLVGKIPVTLLDDAPLKDTQNFPLQLGLEETSRIHFKVTESTRGLLIRPAKNLTHPEFLTVQVYGPNGRSIRSNSKLDKSDTTLVSTPTPGWYQVTFKKYGGTAERVPLEFQVQPLDLRLISNGIDAAQGTLDVENLRKLPLDLSVSLKLAAQIMSETLFRQGPTTEEFKQSITLSQSGLYSVSLNPMNPSSDDNSMHSCFLTQKNAAGVVVNRIADNSLDISLPEGETTGTLDVLCYPFEYTGMGADEPATIGWKMIVTAAPLTDTWKDAATMNQRFVLGRNTLVPKPFTPYALGEVFDVVVSGAFGSTGSVTLGKVTVY
jgi:subtilisin family serine protease